MKPSEAHAGERSSRPVVVPVNLGCCHEVERCLLCAPPPSPPLPETIEALVAHYRDERAPVGAALRVGFYGGPPPDDASLEVLDGLPFVARVRPDLLTRADAARLAEAGAVAIELDALTFDDFALRAIRRRYRSGLVLEQLDGLPELGLQAGIVLAPGLPGTTHDSSVRDAEIAAERVDFARIHPVLVLVDSGLRERHMDATYIPLTVGQAVTTSRAMLERFEACGVPVIRIGQNPAADALGRAVAGPRRAPLRQLVNGRRFLDRLRVELAPVPAGAAVTIRCHPADETAIRGPMSQHLRSLRAESELAELAVRADPVLDRGQLVLDQEGP